MIIKLSPTSKLRRCGLSFWSKLFFAEVFLKGQKINLLYFTFIYFYLSRSLVNKFSFLPIHTPVVLEMRWCRDSRANRIWSTQNVLYCMFKPEHVSKKINMCTSSFIEAFYWMKWNFARRLFSPSLVYINVLYLMLIEWRNFCNTRNACRKRRKFSGQLQKKISLIRCKSLHKISNFPWNNKRKKESENIAVMLRYV